MGVSTESIATALNLLTAGSNVAKFSDGDGERYDVRVKAADMAISRAEDLNAIWPRKVHFFPRTGKVLVKKIKDAGADLASREREYASKLQAKPVGGEIDLF